MLKPLTTRLWTLPRSVAPWIAGIVVLIGAAGAHAQTTVAGELAGNSAYPRTALRPTKSPSRFHRE